MTTVKGPAIFLAQFLGDKPPFNELKSICQWARSLGFVGVQIPTWDARCIDLQKAAELAREMVVNQGMGKKLRDQVFHVDEGMMMERLVHERQYSDETAKVIDDEVEGLITEAANRARIVIRANLDKVEALKKKLIEKETIEAEEVLDVLKGSAMPKAAALY